MNKIELSINDIADIVKGVDRHTKLFANEKPANIVIIQEPTGLGNVITIEIDSTEHEDLKYVYSVTDCSNF